MCEWTNCPGPLYQAPESGQHPPLQQDKPCPFTNDTNEQRAEKERFKFVTSTELSKMSKGYTPANTTKATSWALKTFEQWRRAKVPSEKVPDDILTSTDTLVICTQFSRFAAEARKSDGKPYPPSTIHQLLCESSLQISLTKKTLDSDSYTTLGMFYSMIYTLKELEWHNGNV